MNISHYWVGLAAGDGWSICRIRLENCTMLTHHPLQKGPPTYNGQKKIRNSTINNKYRKILISRNYFIIPNTTYTFMWRCIPGYLVWLWHWMRQNIWVIQCTPIQNHINHITWYHWYYAISLGVSCWNNDQPLTFRGSWSLTNLL